ncbi:MAG: ABC transporter permease [Phycisphaerales bacterium]
MRTLPLEYAVRNLVRSRQRLLLAVVGSALVVLLVLAAASFVRGMTFALSASGGVHNVMLVGTGSEDSIERSEIPSNAGGIVAASVRGIAESAGTLFVSPEVHIQLPLQVGSAAGNSLVLVRGVTPVATLVHERVQITEGRFPASGADEVMVGARAANKLGVDPALLRIGNAVRIDNREWTVAGRFVAPGTVAESEVWAPLNDLKEATKRESDSVVVLTLDPSRAEFADVEAFARTRLDLQLTALRESDYYAGLAEFFGPIRVVAWVTAGLIAVGGVFGGLNTMHAAFASRVRELGMLQSLGFRRGAIVASLTQESLLATMAGSLIACAIAVVLLDGVAVRFSMGVFGLVVDAGVLALGLAAGVTLGLIGALPPAAQCLRLPIPVALKAV